MSEPDTNGDADGNENGKSAIVDICGLHHAYTRAGQSQNILNDVNLRLTAAETVVLIGRSGSGKSTLLNLCGALEPVQQGSISLFGCSLSPLNDKQRTLLRRERIGFIYQSFNLIPTLSVADNICLPLALAGHSNASQADALSSILDEIGLQSRHNDYPDQLSGGEQQRVAIARALIHKPGLILADEPTGNLDAESGRHILHLLHKLVAQQQSALLLVTHSLEVARMADRAFAMRDGSLHALTQQQLNGSSAW